jgi:hypothetical protein
MQKLLALWATTPKNIHEPKLGQFSVLLPTMWKIVWRFRQQCEKFSCDVVNNGEHVPALWATTQKNV